MQHYTGGVQDTLAGVTLTPGYRIWVYSVCNASILGKGLSEKWPV